jgi:hypothetical protein
MDKIFNPNFLDCNWYRRPDDKKVLVLLGGADVRDFRMWAGELDRLLTRNVSDHELMRSINFTQKELRAVQDVVSREIIPKKESPPGPAGEAGQETQVADSKSAPPPKNPGP